MTMLKKLGLSLAVALFAVTSTLSTAQAAPAQLDKTVKVQPIKKGKQITAIKGPRFAGGAAGAGAGVGIGLAIAVVVTVAIAADISGDEPCVSGCN